MKLHWTEVMAVTALVGAGCIAIYAGLSRVLQRAVAARQRETERQMSAMATTVKALQARVAELGRLHAAQTQEGDFAIVAPAKNDAGRKNEPVKPEIVAAMTAAATAFLGKKARIRSARQVADESAGAWAQQGRVIVQTSHNLRPNG
ncbi:conserved hypothetical protein [Candidatus Sulfotelmatomonas gaucii]|uniref:Uncharacterized protein n=1 Tax=Candidatus Sulfuritelmatomonas gaucii TaxID=2043161 RepID=A0A2N9LEJ7_9BACT|nr:conserved hypothetical protein [Candidatus Sulfotelmatomonas gaucii]